MAGRLKIKAQVILGEEIALGPGKADLLDWVDKTGSITAAARGMGLSYRRAWLMIDTMNRCFDAPMVSTAHGGAKGGGARLTDQGRAALAAYRALQADLNKASAKAERALLTALRAAGPAPAPAGDG
jgi:molybdate transport system regulatory protein